MKELDWYEAFLCEQDDATDYYVYYLCLNCGQLDPIAARYLRERLIVRAEGKEAEIMCLHCKGTMEVQ